jgi:hypothetical protein
MGLLKRLRLSPLTTLMFLAATALSFIVVALIQVVLLLLVGRFGYGLHGPHFTGLFPIRHMITALVDSYNGIPGDSVWSDVEVMLVWGAVGVFVAVRRWQWPPRR